MGDSRSQQLDARPDDGLRVLVADDVALNLRIVAGLLKKMGHGCVLVEDGEQALHALQAQAFDVVLLDASMPVLDGLGVLHKMRAVDGSADRRIPVIMVSGHAMPEDKERFMVAGADGFVPKPVHYDELRDEIARVTGRG